MDIRTSFCALKDRIRQDWIKVYKTDYEAKGGCLNLLMVSRSLRAGPSFMLNFSIKCCSFNKNKLCPSISLITNGSAYSLYPWSFRNADTSSVSHSEGFCSNVPNSVR